MSLGPKQPKAAYILNLPVELIILFAQNLPLFDQYKLAQVSSAFRSILKDRFDQRTIVEASPEDKLSYLSIRALSLPDYWVCEQCIDLHPYDPEDNPSPGLFPDGTRGCPRRFISPCSFRFQKYRLHHRHVQLALKYHRMSGLGGDGPFALRLSRLLKGGFHRPMVEHQNFSFWGFQNRGMGRYSWQPKIVGGRFLLMTKIEFYPTSQDLTGVWTDLVPALPMCQHQMWLPLYIRTIDVLVSHWAMFSPVGEAQLAKLRAAVHNDLHRAVTAMRWAPGEPVTVSCPHCATDIGMKWSTHLGKYKFTAIGWYDFGSETLPTETLPMSTTWLANIDPARFRPIPSVKWEPGRVMKLWYSCT